MTDTTTVAGLHDVNDEHGHVHHPTDLDYVKVAVGLAVLTAIEVVLSYVNALEGIWLVAPLLIVMAIKFVIVAAQFMHLKFDSKVLTRVFYAGLLLAVGVYLIALTSFHLFSKDRCDDGTKAGAVAASCSPR